ncbi:MAG: hypothetical protein ACI4FZ_01455 [Lachnospiraceae bacterium]
MNMISLRKIVLCICTATIICFVLQKTEVLANEYQGIQIDGDFSDWDAVQKTGVYDGKLNEVAFVFDGDYLYFYIDARENWTASNVGAHSNGRYSVTTDLGRVMQFQLKDANKKPQIQGVNDAEIAHSDLTYGFQSYLYEFSIPTSELPEYREYLSFGPYLGEPYISDIANLQGEPADPDSSRGDFTGIIYDGSFDDWAYYPHSVIQYATSGTHHDEVDGHAALYSDGDVLYGHVYTSMPTHLQSAGGDMTSAITIGINSLPNEFFEGYDRDEWFERWPLNWMGQWQWMHDRLDQFFYDKSNFWPEYAFYPQFIAVDSEGNINYNPKLSGLSNGTYEFYLIDSQGWKNANNIWQWEDPSAEYIYGGNAVYGRAMLVIGPSKNEMEFEIYIDKLADKFHMEPQELHAFCARFGRIGHQWVSCAGTSTGPILGIVLCILAVAFVLIRRRLKGKEQLQSMSLTTCEAAQQK